MKQSIINILKGKFLISGEAIKNWRLIFFLSLLAVIMIASSHNIDKKVHQITTLNNQVKELRSEFVATRAILQELKLESTIAEKVKQTGLLPSTVPPKKIQVTNKN